MLEYINYKIKEFRPIIIIILIIIMVCFTSLIAIFINNEAKDCLRQPYFYATKKIDDKIGLTSCNCVIQTSNLSIFFYFNSSYMGSIGDNSRTGIKEGLNYSLLRQGG